MRIDSNESGRFIVNAWAIVLTQALDASPDAIDEGLIGELTEILGGGELSALLLAVQVVATRWSVAQITRDGRGHARNTGPLIASSTASPSRSERWSASGGSEGRAGAADSPRRDGGDLIERLVGRTIPDIEHALVVATLRRTGGNRTRAAAVLGISLRTLRNKLHQYEEAASALMARDRMDVAG